MKAFVQLSLLLLSISLFFSCGTDVNDLDSNGITIKRPNSKEGYSYLKKETDGYIFEIYWKRKYGSVFVEFEVYSWVKPPSHIPNKEFFLMKIIRNQSTQQI